MSVKVRIKDSGESPDMKRIRALLGQELVFRVGITKESGAPLHSGGSGLTIAEVGALHEYGVGVPRRPFVSGWFMNNRNKLHRTIAGQAKLVFKGRKDFSTVAERLGPAFARSMKREMQAMPPPLAAATVRKKGDARTLVETFQLFRHISYEYEVRRKTGAAL